MTSLAETIREGAYERVRYVDPWGDHIIRLDVLMELLPDWVDIHGHSFRQEGFERLAPVDVGPQVWETHSWPALSQAGLGKNLHLPSVFTLGDTVYTVRMDCEVFPDDGGGAAIVATPLVLDIGGTSVANVDLPDQMYHVQDPRYLLDVRARAMRMFPPISLALLHHAGFELRTVKVLDGRVWTIEHPGTTLLTARPLNDMDMIDVPLLCGEDGPRLFLTELPGRVTTLDDALADLCALIDGEEGFRQGAWWFVEADDDELGKHGRPPGKYERSTGVRAIPMTKSERMKRNARRKPGQHPPGDFDGMYEGKLARLHSSSDHFAQELVRGDNGTLYVRGLLRHRRHHHEPLRLDRWHRVYHNGQIRTWTTDGPYHD